jgi:hypothetical protein
MTLSARPLDHCVLPTADPVIARARLTALGFTVAPEGRHPFGTANCCVYFKDGTFLEPLAVVDAAAVATASNNGNVFTARDSAFRQRIGQEGFSALVLGTSDAGRDHRAFLRAHVSAGPPLDFSRPFIDASGQSDTASFRLAFAADPSAPDVFFFTCERVNAPAVDRSALQRHANGVRHIKAIVLDAPQPSDFAEFLASILDCNPVATSEGFRFAAANGDVLLRRKADVQSGLRLAEIVLGSASLPDTAALLDLSRIPYAIRSDRLIVASAPGQGAAFAFEDESTVGRNSAAVGR